MSSTGMPATTAQKIVPGTTVAYSATTSTPSRPAKPSTISSICCRISGSSRAISRGESAGFNALRSSSWIGGSHSTGNQSGIPSGRLGMKPSALLNVSQSFAQL